MSNYLLSSISLSILLIVVIVRESLNNLDNLDKEVDNVHVDGE